MAERNIGWSFPAESGLNWMYPSHTTAPKTFFFLSKATGSSTCCMTPSPQLNYPTAVADFQKWICQKHGNCVEICHQRKENPAVPEETDFYLTLSPIPHTYIYIYVFPYTQDSFIVIMSCHSLQSLSYISQSHMFFAHAEMSYIYAAFINFLPCRSRMFCLLFSLHFLFLPLCIIS